MLPTKFCNGTTTTCDGLSQWGSQDLAQQGYNSIEILRNYYGDDIELVVDAPIQDIVQTYPGTPLRLGSSGEQVVVVQAMLNRISQNYPAIPKIRPVTGVFNEATEQAVRQFQRIFSLTPDGVVGKATWYRMVYLYVGVTRLSELISEGQTFTNIQFQYPGVLREGDSGGEVRILQYMLALMAEFDNELLPITVDGDFGPRTTQAVRQYQSLVGLTPDGVVGEATWNSIYRHFARADAAARRDTARFPRDAAQVVPAAAWQVQSGSEEHSSTVRLGQYPGFEMGLGDTDRREAVQV